jgi:hypothetical protein
MPQENDYQRSTLEIPEMNGGAVQSNKNAVVNGLPEP